jgi:tetratricopeptide (TPR) repeat protein
VSWESLVSGERIPGRDFTTGERLLTESRVVIWYLTLIAWPTPDRLNLEHDVAPSRSLVSPATTLGSLLLVLTILVLAVTLERRGHPVASFAILWYFLGLGVESTILPLELAFEHRLYLPSVGPILLVVLGLSRLAVLRGTRTRVGVAIALATVLGIATRQRNETWAELVSIYRDGAEKSPRKPRALSNYGFALAKEKRYREALDYFQRAIEIEPEFWDARRNLQRVHVKLAAQVASKGSLDEARRLLATALLLEPGDVEATIHLGNVLFDLAQDEADPGRTRELRQDAVNLLGPAFSEHPEVADLGLALAKHLTAAGRADEALGVVDRVLAANQGMAPAHLVRGWALYQQRRLPEAEAAFRAALAIDGGYTNAANGLGMVLGELARWDEAIEAFERAIELDPVHARARLNLGATYERMKRPLEALRTYQDALARVEKPLAKGEFEYRIARLYAIALPDPGSNERRAHAARALELGARGTMEAELRRWLEDE